MIPVDLREVRLDHIDFKATRYNLRPVVENRAPADLVDSIRQYALLHPPLVHQISAQQFEVLSGRRRLLAARSLGIGWPFCLVLDRTITPACQARLQLEHIQTTTSLSIIEQARFIQIYMEKLGKEAALQLLKPLGHQPGSHRLQWLLDFLRLTPVCQQALYKGSLSPRAGTALIPFSATDQDKLTELIERLRFGTSKQLRLIHLARELCMRPPGTSLVTLIAPWEQQHLQQDDHGNIPQKGTLLLQWLHTACCPRSTAAKQEFRRFVGQLNLPAGMTISHTPAFEDDTLVVSLTFPNREALQEKLSYIKKIQQESNQK